MTYDYTRAVAELLIGPCNDIAHQVFHVNSCIGQTRIVLDVFEHFGIDAMPMPVRTEAHNDLAVQSMKLNLDFDQFLAGSMTIAINGTGKVDMTKPTEPWDGHIVAWVPQPRMLLDPTVGQFSKPNWGIPLPNGILIDLDASPQYASFDPYSDDPGNYLAIEGDSGEIVVYYPLVDIDHDSWRESANWRDTEGVCQHLTAAFIHYITKKLEREDVVLQVTRTRNSPYGFVVEVVPYRPETTVAGAQLFGAGVMTRADLAAAAAVHRDR